ncbi:unnamed protein product [Linum tenue]|uniref:Homeobox domain-containing protein n=1 Tax=Linum tenue TaxID=586396 RepID=A0AAV0J032_9ROSI|nr:unnamed protein product [Linum tenue]
MELALSLGDASKPFKFLDKTPPKISTKDHHLGFCMGLGAGGGGGGAAASSSAIAASPAASDTVDRRGDDRRRVNASSSTDTHTPLQLDLLPFSPVLRRPAAAAAAAAPSEARFPWLIPADPALTSSEHGAMDGSTQGRRLDVNRLSGEEGDDAAALSSPNSGGSSFQMDFGIGSGAFGRGKRDLEAAEAERAGSRASDDDENGSTRKKLRLSKDQSAFLEESFKEHNTLNPKQKVALAKQLNLRPRQVEVWFQNRRARTKLKQTEVDCEYLKRCCETLTEENRRLQKELQELRALKTSQPFYMQLPATTLTMCPSCERVATTTTNTSTPSTAAPTSTSASPITTVAAAATGGTNNSSTALSLGKPGGEGGSNGSSNSNGSRNMHPFVQQLHMSKQQQQQQPQPNQPAAS